MFAVGTALGGDRSRARRFEPSQAGKPDLRSEHVGCLHVLGSKSDADHTRGDSPQVRESPQQLQGPGDAELRVASDHSAEDAILDQNLEALGQPGRELTPDLHFLKIVRCRGPVS